MDYGNSKIERSEIENFFKSNCESNKTRVVLGLQKMATGLGFFQIGSKLNAKYCLILIKEGGKSKNFYRKSRAIKALISIGHLKDARVLLKSLEIVKLSNTKQTNFIRLVYVFLDLCESREINGSSDNSEFDDYIRNKNILLLGPAETKNKIFENKFKNYIVCRRVGIGSDEFDSSQNYRLRNKIAYCDNNYLRNKTGVVKWMNKERIAFLVNNHAVNSNQFGIRSGRNFNELFVSGSANKMQIAIYDLLLGSPKSIHCDGITFFATSVSYTAENLDINHDGNVIKQNGSDGAQFYTSVALAEHNVFVNRRMAINLCRNSKIRSSRVMTNILDLDDDGYAKILDKLYGLDKL
jgi:hypothetical protein